MKCASILTPPNQVNIKNTPNNTNPVPRTLIAMTIINEPANPNTPTAFEGMQRRIPYAKRKYHSGLICSGVFIASQCAQLSASINITAHNIITISIERIVINTVTPSLLYHIVNRLPSPFPTALPLTYSCSKCKCKTISPRIIIGSRKCSEKNRPRHAPPNENPPQTMITISSPIGRTLTKLVITVAPQKDICPQGNTYPKNDALIVRINNTTPTFHRLDLRNDL
jgi:hypothetical protein